MRRWIALVLLLVVGCGTASKSDKEAAREFVHSFYSAPGITVEMTTDEEPEYATFPKIPRDHLAREVPDRSAASAVHVRFTWREENRTTHDDMLVWVDSNHKAVGWSMNPQGDRWRSYVRSYAQK